MRPRTPTHSRRRAQIAAVLIATCLWDGAVRGAEPPQAPARVEGRVLRALDSGLSGPSAQVLPGEADVLLVLRERATEPLLKQLNAAGAELVVSETGGKPIHLDNLVPAHIGKPALSRLLALPFLDQIRHLPPRGPMPLDQSAKQLSLALARGARPQLDSLTGAGVVIADIDTNVDVFHPHFFRGDGGYFDWLDVDKDGKFTAGKDAIDLDRDGAAGETEAAQLLRAETLYAFSSDKANARRTGFDPGIDWLYLDENKNNRRDFSAVDEFDDTAPALGEPLFVPDDVNQNGVLDPGERVVRLGTSKFRKISVRLDRPRVMRTFTRGMDLSQLKTDYSKGRFYGYGDAVHASGVLSILAGDLPLVGRRFVGVAPDAELLLGWQAGGQEALPASATMWALNEGAQVLLYELAPWTGVELDGSDPLSLVIDKSPSKVVHACPVGNIGGSQKHVRASLSGGTFSQSFNLPKSLGGQPVVYIQLSQHLRGGRLSYRLREPSGMTHTVQPGMPFNLSTGALAYPTEEMSPRGTHLSDIVLYAESPQTAPLPDGIWTILGSGPQTAVVDAYLADNVSGFGPGVTFPKAQATDDRTIAVPSTADRCIAVGAHTGHGVSANEPWFYGDEPEAHVREYSGRGPRLDGTNKMDVVAPDNPFAAVPVGPVYGGLGAGSAPHGALAPFGGTSGAGPHVAGALGLLVQAGVVGDAAKEAIRKGAQSHPSYGSFGALPNEVAGAGRLSAAASLGVPEAPDKKPPKVVLLAEPAKAPVGAMVKLTPMVQGGSGTWQSKWDDGYDGSWDTPYVVMAQRTFVKKAGKEPFKVRVRDADGLVSEAVIWVEEGMPEEMPTGCGCRVLGRRPVAAKDHLGMLIFAGFAGLAGYAGLAGRSKRRRRRLT